MCLGPRQDFQFTLGRGRPGACGFHTHSLLISSIIYKINTVLAGWDEKANKYVSRKFPSLCVPQADLLTAFPAAGAPGVFKVLEKLSSPGPVLEPALRGGLLSWLSLDCWTPRLPAALTPLRARRLPWVVVSHVIKRHGTEPPQHKQAGRGASSLRSRA